MKGIIRAVAAAYCRYSGYRPTTSRSSQNMREIAPPQTDAHNNNVLHDRWAAAPAVSQLSRAAGGTRERDKKPSASHFSYLT